ncbi:MAG: AtpZ/AtpI family protein [Pseudomonadota bacterium]|nr:AtpZ/AtpI family protein [Pseudomonadota bacterium]
MPDDLPSLDELQRKINKARDSGEKQDASGSSGAGRGMQMGLELVAGVAVGCVIGYGLDRWLGTLPLFLILFLFLGAAAGFRNMIRQAGKIDE